jgi:predicted DNA-binding transcriptional regulator AlpA
MYRRETKLAIMRIAAVLKETGLSRPTIWRWERDGRFPKRVKLGPNSVGWDSAEIEAWLKRKLTNRDMEMTGPRGKSVTAAP